VRKGRCGLTIEGEAPQRHSFPVKFLNRELNDAVRVYVSIPTVDGELRYEVTDIQKHEWIANRIATPQPEPRRRWWQRKKK
jgi:hypothetical protein